VIKAILTFQLLLVAGMAVAGNLIEFSDTDYAFTGEGVTYHKLVFKDDKRTISYQPPAGWKCRLAGNQLQLVPPDKTLCEAKISSVALDTPIAVDEHLVAGFNQQVLAELPTGAQQGVVVKQEQNALLLNGNPTLRAEVSYVAFGQRYQRSVLLVITPKNQIRFQLTARAADFDAADRAFRPSILSWEWAAVPPSEPPDGAGPEASQP
jgi:hypothetical protein